MKEAILKKGGFGWYGPVEPCRGEKLEEEEGFMSMSIILTAPLKMCLVYSEWIEGSSPDSNGYCDDTFNVGITNTEVD